MSPAALVLLCWSTFAVQPASNSPQESAVPSPELAVELYEGACRSIVAFDAIVQIDGVVTLHPTTQGLEYFDLERTTNVPAECQSHHLTRQRFSRGRLRVDVLRSGARDFKEGDLVYVWDGEQFKLLNAPESRGQIDFRVPDARNSFGCCLLDLLSGNSNGSYASIIRQRGLQTLSVRRSDAGAVVVKVPRRDHSGLSGFGFEFEFRPSTGFLPQRIDWFRVVDGSEVLESRITSQIEEREGVWFPVAAQRDIFVTDRTSRHFRKLISRQTVSVLELRTNPDIADDVFSVSFPMGTMVRDVADVRNYVIGESTPEDHLRHLAAAGRLGAERMAASRSTAIPAAGGFLDTRLLLLVVNLILFVVIVGMVLVDRRRKNSGKSDEAL